jgi:hypothetical protein
MRHPGGGVMLNGSTPVSIPPTDKPHKLKVFRAMLCEGVTLKGNTPRTSAL